MVKEWESHRLKIMEETLQKILDRYDGPILVERLNFLGSKEDSDVTGMAALHALNHLNKVSQYSPHVDQLVHRASKITNKTDEMFAQQLQYADPGWSAGLQNHKATMLKENNADTLYHESNPDKNIKVATIYMYNRMYPEANNAIAASTHTNCTCLLGEYSSQCGLLQGNYNNVTSNDKRMDSFISNSAASEMYQKRLTPSEVTSFWRAKFLIVIALYLKKDYDEVIKFAFELVDQGPVKTAEGVDVKALDILEAGDFNGFIHRDEIIIAVVISALLSKDSTELNDVLADHRFIALLGPASVSMVRPMFTSFINADFKKLFSLLDDLSPSVETNVLLSRTWADVRLQFRRKSYILYLSLIKRVKISHLAQKLNLEQTRLVRELKELIKEKELDYEITGSNDDMILEDAVVDKHALYHDRLQKIAEAADSLESKLSAGMTVQDSSHPTRDPGLVQRIAQAWTGHRENTRTPPEHLDYQNTEV